MTIFEPLETLHLTKDVGLVPAQFAKQTGGPKARILYRDRGQDVVVPPTLTDVLEVEGITSSGTLGFYLKAFAVARQMPAGSVIHLFHVTRYSLLLLWLLHQFARHLLLYLKLDTDMKNARVLCEPRTGAGELWRRLRLAVLGQANVVSIETRDAYDYVKACGNALSQRIYYLPNGIWADFAARVVGDKLDAFDAKERLILHVARAGTEQKNSEAMLDGFLASTLAPSWKLCFIGTMTSEFKARLAAVKQTHPALANQVSYLGELDQHALFNYYARAQMLCLTSRWESSALVLVEAAFFGTYLVSTKVGAFPDVTDGYRLGSPIEGERAEDVKDALERAVARPAGGEASGGPLDSPVGGSPLGSASGNSSATVPMAPRCAAQASYCRRHFAWERLISQLAETLEPVGRPADA